MTAKKKGRYNVAIIGLGRIASILEDDPLRSKPCTHAGAFATHPKTRIIAGCDVNPERTTAFGKRWGVKKLYSDYRQMLAREKPDIVSVATWTESHSKIVVDCAEAGVKGIYCEKPIAVNLKQAREMIKACERNGVAMVVGHERRWDRRHQALKAALAAGEIGELRSMTGYMLTGTWPKLSRRIYGGGPVFHDGTHLVDLFRFFAGDAAFVTAVEDRPHGSACVENTVTGIIEFKNGARGLLIAGGERRYFHFELDIQTDKARAVMTNHIAELYVAKTSKFYTGFTELERAEFPTPGNDVNAFVGGVSDLISQMETGAPPLSSGHDGYKALEIITALYRSAGKGGARVKLPL
ncbi:MAG: Gfo/Idh/MocA family oxidoreductase [Nitrospinae bacterium]|nr:Gfo/Idh/MocA family oxidoreductase [Nitrospinota bacterium]